MRRKKQTKSIDAIKAEIVAAAKRRAAKRHAHTVKKHNKSVRRVLRPLSYQINSPAQAEAAAKALDNFFKRHGR